MEMVERSIDCPQAEAHFRVRQQREEVRSRCVLLGDEDLIAIELEVGYDEVHAGAGENTVSSTPLASW